MPPYGPFKVAAATTAIAASTTSTSGAIAPGSGAVRIYNASTAVAFWRTGQGSPTALVTDTPIAAGAVEVFSISDKDNAAAVISPSGTGTIYFTPGEGL